MTSKSVLPFRKIEFSLFALIVAACCACLFTLAVSPRNQQNIYVYQRDADTYILRTDKKTGAYVNESVQKYMQCSSKNIKTVKTWKKYQQLKQEAKRKKQEFSY